MNLVCVVNASRAAQLDTLFEPADEAQQAANEDIVPQQLAALSPTTVAPALDEAQLAALVLAIADQHEPSLGRLYEATAGRVFGLALRIVRQPALAEEVVEDVFWQVWREAPRFDADRGRVLAWLLAIARSRAIDALRRHDRVHCHEQAGDEGGEETRADDGACDPQEQAAAAQHQQHLQTLLAALDPLPRQLLSLAFFRGCTHEEIATHTGLALGTVKSQIRRTLAALRSQLAPLGISA
jgi:RNA polymerase sigma-70 factor (ECF subfamily)